jgi:CheY-like chemotaxis protein
MNLNFILAGAPNPSAFYVVIQVVLFLSNTGAILGFDKILSHKIHYAFLIAQPEHKTIRPAAERKFFLALVFITLMSALYSVFYIKEFSPNSVHDQAMILFVLAMISSAAFFTKYYYLIQHRIKFLVVDDESDAQDVMEDFIQENFEIEIVKVGTISEAQVKLVKDPNIVLIISDYNMPKSEENLDGGDLYLFNKGHKDLPFLLFSEEKVEDHKKLDNFYNDNIHNHIIGKPFDKKTTKECIENIVVFYMV